jgi:hypothetical protein
MGYYTDEISISRIDEIDLGLIVTAKALHADRVIQCYVSGDLVAWQQPEEGIVRFVLQQAGPEDTILLLAVDAADSATDYWSEAFGTDDVYGNRVQVDFRLDLLDGYRPGDKWRVYRGNAGDSEAAMKLYEAEVFPGGRGVCGWGQDWGNGGWGYSGSNAPGWGYHWGYTWGFGIDYLRFLTGVLTRGTYPVKVDVVDEHGNASTAYETSVVIDTFARPADDLAVSSYTKDTDTLVLAMTPSEDIS